MDMIIYLSFRFCCYQYVRNIAKLRAFPMRLNFDVFDRSSSQGLEGTIED